MALPAPRRCSVECEHSDGLPGQFYFTRPWAEDNVRRYVKVGGWFMVSAHDFASKDAARLATDLSTPTRGKS